MPKRRTAWEHLRGLWDIHWSVKVLAASWLALTATETILPFCSDSWSKKFYSLTYIPQFRWYVWVISALAILVIVIFDASLRYANKEMGGAEPNLVWLSTELRKLGCEKGKWSETPTHGFTQSSFVAVIKNEPKYDQDVSSVSVRAEMRVVSGEGERIFSPLTWNGSEDSAVEIGVGDFREVIIAVRQNGQVMDMWDFVVKGKSGATDSWVPVFDFELHIKIIDAVSGREIPFRDKTKIKWNWPEDRRLPRLSQIVGF